MIEQRRICFRFNEGWWVKMYTMLTVSLKTFRRFWLLEFGVCNVQENIKWHVVYAVRASAFFALLRTSAIHKFSSSLGQGSKQLNVAQASVQMYSNTQISGSHAFCSVNKRSTNELSGPKGSAKPQNNNKWTGSCWQITKVCLSTVNRGLRHHSLSGFGHWKSLFQNTKKIHKNANLKFACNHWTFWESVLWSNKSEIELSEFCHEGQI